LDTFDDVFLWVGEQSNKSWKQLALEVVEEYIQKATGRSRTLKGKYVEHGHEPLEFGMAFHGFKFSVSKTSEKGTGLISNLIQKEFPKVTTTFTLTELKSKDNLPATLDKMKLEIYLSDEEFIQVFEMDKATWEKKPQWQRLEIRKKIGLY